LSNFIGAGEDLVNTILVKIAPKHWDIQRQVSIKKLIKKEDFEFLDGIHQKHKVDFAISIDAKRGTPDFEEQFIGVIRVQGWDHTSGKKGIAHGQKSNKDTIQKKLFEDNELWVVDILFNECPNIFEERLNWDSVIEFCNMMKMVDVPL